MPLRLELVTRENQEAFSSLIQLYLHELSAFQTEPVDDHCRFAYPYMEDCLDHRGREARYIVVRDKIAGFAVIRTEGSICEVTDFFVLNGYRNLSIGRDSANLIFQERPGEWRVNALESSQVARAFWRTVVREVTQRHYSILHDKVRGLVSFTFIFPGQFVEEQAADASRRSR